MWPLKMSGESYVIWSKYLEETTEGVSHHYLVKAKLKVKKGWKKRLRSNKSIEVTKIDQFENTINIQQKGC